MRLKARLDARNDPPTLIAMEIALLELVADGGMPLRINLPLTRLNEGMIDRLKRLLSEHPGTSQVLLHLGDDKVARLPDEFCVDTTTGLLGALRELLGPGAVIN